MMEEVSSRDEITAQTAEIVAAFVAHNLVPVMDLPNVIRSVHLALSTLGQPTIAPDVAALEPAVSIKKSVTPDYIICLEDGKKFKSLKRHLATSFQLTPDAYRARWGLPAGYPMVAPNYAATRSALAKTIGLGKKAAPVTKLMAPSKRSRKTAAS